MSSELTYYAKVVDGIVTDVHVVEWDFLIANPERYGDPALWIQCFQDGSGRGYCGKGWLYDADADKFVQPPTPDDEV
jgi:hypothetical protein